MDFVPSLMDRQGASASYQPTVGRLHADTHPGNFWKYLLGHHLAGTFKTKVAGTLRVFIVPEAQRAATVNALDNSTNEKTKTFVHIPSAASTTLSVPAVVDAIDSSRGGSGNTAAVGVDAEGGSGVGSVVQAAVMDADADGEPEMITGILSAAAPAGHAVVVWRCYGGKDPSPEELQRVYSEVVTEAVESYKTKASAATAAAAAAEEAAAAAAAAAPTYKDSASTNGGKGKGPMHTPLPRKVLAGFVLPLPVPCVAHDGSFLPAAEADRLFHLFSPPKKKQRADGSNSCDVGGGEIEWAYHPRVNHGTAIYGDAGVVYASATTAGYASSVVHSWTDELLVLREQVEQWHLDHVGRSVRFNVCLLNRYENGAESLGWHADREEMDPSVDAPRASPIVSISLGSTRQFGLRRHGSKSIDVVRLVHGSLLLMENACQFLYKHALLQEKGVDGARVNLTFRSKQPVLPAKAAPVLLQQVLSSPFIDGSSLPPPSAVFVGQAVETEEEKWKSKLHHPWESPFIDDLPTVAAARYAVWLCAQPIFLRWVRTQLAGKYLAADTGTVTGDQKERLSKHNQAHANMLAALVAAPDVAHQDIVVPSPTAMGKLCIGNLRALRLKRGASSNAGGTAAGGAKRDTSVMPCRDFAKGRCTRGDACRFSHENHGQVEGFAKICVDRSTVLGNPFKMGADGKNELLRDKVCDAYAALLASPGANPADIGLLHGVPVDDNFSDAATSEKARTKALLALKARLVRGESLRLLCWCAPRRCHAEEIARWLTKK